MNDADNVAERLSDTNTLNVSKTWIRIVTDHTSTAKQLIESIITSAKDVY